MRPQIGVSTSVFSGERISIEKLLEKVHSNGFNLVEIIASYPTMKISQIREKKSRTIREIARKLGLRIQLHAPFYSINLADFDPEVREFSLKEILDVVYFGSEIDTELITIHAGLCFLPCKLMYREAIDLLADSLSTLNEKAESFGIRISLEIRASPFDIGKPGELIYLIRKVGGTNLGITFDTVQAQLLGDPIKIFKQVKDFCINAHLRDSKKGMEEALPVGAGDINFDNLLIEMIKSGFSGPFILEVKDLRSALISKKEILEILRRNKIEYQT